MILQSVVFVTTRTRINIYLFKNRVRNFIHTVKIELHTETQMRKTAETAENPGPP